MMMMMMTMMMMTTRRKVQADSAVAHTTVFNCIADDASYGVMVKCNIFVYA